MARAKSRYEKDARGRNIYPEETRLEAVRRVLAGATQRAVAEQLGLTSPSLLASWLIRARRERGDPIHGAGSKRLLALERVRAGLGADAVADAMFLKSETLQKWIDEDRAANEPPVPVMPPGGPVPSVNSFAAPLPFPPRAPEGEIAEPEPAPAPNGSSSVQLSGFTMQIDGLPTRAPREVSRVHPNTRAKPLIVRAECPHCASELPLPPRQRPGCLVATQWACPSCEGPVTLP